MKIDWFTTLVRHFANVANASDQPTYIGPMLVCCLGIAQRTIIFICIRHVSVAVEQKRNTHTQHTHSCTHSHNTPYIYSYKETAKLHKNTRTKNIIHTGVGSGGMQGI